MRQEEFFGRWEEGIYRYRLPLFGAAFLLLISVPFWAANQYLLTVGIRIGIYAILALGLNILTGYTGLVSLGHAGFVAIGAYTSALLSTKLGVGFFAGMLGGMVLAGVAGIVLGLPTLRVSGTYLSIITLGFGEIVRMIALNWSEVTNGTMGVKNIPRPMLFGIPLNTANFGLYYLTLILLSLTALFCYLLIRTKTGRALRAVKEDETAARMMGIDSFRQKVLAFVLSAVICALGGSLYSVLVGYIEPGTFSFDVSTLILSIVILGGMGTVRGMIAGALILVAFPELSRFLMEYRFVLYGVILVVMMRFRPQGILGWPSRLPYAPASRRRQEAEKGGL